MPIGDCVEFPVDDVLDTCQNPQLSSGLQIPGISSLNGIRSLRGFFPSASDYSRDAKTYIPAFGTASSSEEIEMTSCSPSSVWTEMTSTGG